MKKYGTIRQEIEFLSALMDRSDMSRRIYILGATQALEWALSSKGMKPRPIHLLEMISDKGAKEE